MTLEEEEEDTPHIDTWHNARVWVDFFDGFALMTTYIISEREM